MQKNLTLKSSMFFTMVLAFFSFAGVANAQFYIEILSGDNAGTRIDFTVGATTPLCVLPFDDELTSQMTNPVLADVAVDALNGNVGVCRRGAVSFDIKATNIEAAGGSGSIIINNDESNPDAVIGMAQTAGAFSIWSLMVSFNSGKIFDVPGGVTFAFRHDVEEDTDVILWEDGQFDGGIGNWTTEGLQCSGADQDPSLAVWQWSPYGVTQGLYGGTSIASASVCNGAMFFNSDLYDTDNVEIGAGPCNALQIGELTSPSIDLSGYPEETVLVMKFTQVTRQFQSAYYVGWSDDDGANWTYIPINTEIVVNSGYENSIQRVKLVGAKPTANFKIKFRYEGNYYFWIVDDVKIVEPEDHNIKVASNWVAGPIYPMNHVSQPVTNKFMTDVENKGGRDATNVVLTGSVEDSQGNVIYEATHDYGTIPAGDTIENVVFGEYVTPSEPGVYKVKYSVTMDSTDFDDSDNSYERNFIVSDKQWGREDGATRSISRAFADGERVDWIYSNIFLGEKGGASIDSVTFEVVNADDMILLEDPTVSFFIYEGEDSDGDLILTNEEYSIVGYGEHVFTDGGDEGYLNLTLPIFDLFSLEEKSIVVQEGKFYILGLVYQQPESSTGIQYLFYNANDQYVQEATEYIGTLDGETYRPYSHYKVGFLSDDVVNISRNRDRFANIVPTSRFIMDGGVGTKKAPKLNDATFEVFPTNASESVNVAFNFGKNTDVLVDVVDVNGKSVYNAKFQGQTNQTRDIRVANFAPGSYFVKVTTTEGTLTKPFNVIK